MIGCYKLRILVVVSLFYCWFVKFLYRTHVNIMGCSLLFTYILYDERGEGYAEDGCDVHQ